MDGGGGVFRASPDMPRQSAACRDSASARRMWTARAKHVKHLSKAKLGRHNTGRRWQRGPCGSHCCALEDGELGGTVKGLSFTVSKSCVRRAGIVLAAALVVATPTLAAAQSGSDSEGKSDSGSTSAGDAFNSFLEDLDKAADKLGGNGSGGDAGSAGDGDTEAAASGEGKDGKPKKPENFEQKLKDALDQSDELRAKMREIKHEMARIFHRVRVAQKAIGAQYVQLGRNMALVHQQYQKIAKTGGDGSLLTRLADASMKTQEGVERVTTYAMRYEERPDLKGLILQAHRNTLKISALRGAVEKLRGEYAEMFQGVVDEADAVDPQSLQGQKKRQKRLLNALVDAGNKMTTPLIRQTEKSEAVLRDVAERYRSLSEEMEETVADFNETGGRYAVEAGKQIAIMAGLVTYMTQDTDSVAGFVSKIGAGVATVQKLKEFIDEFRQFRDFYGWFKENKSALEKLNRQTRQQSTQVRESVSDMVVTVQSYRKDIVNRLDKIEQAQEGTLDQAAQAFKAAAKEAKDKATSDAEDERENLASGMSSGFPSTAKTS